MSTVISLDDFRKTAKEQKNADPMDKFTPKTKSDDLANLLMAGLYKGLNNCDIDPLAEENHELLTGVHELVSAITARHFSVFNELNATRDIQAKDGDPFYMIGVAVSNKEENNG